MIDKIEKFAKIKFEKVGPPQAIDIMTSSCKEAVSNLDHVYDNLNEEILDVFKVWSEEILAK